jgi:hypothetical protein
VLRKVATNTINEIVMLISIIFINYKRNQLFVSNEYLS